MTSDWDAVIVGRSFAGLSAALVLGRMRRSVLVIGSGGPRNDAVAHAHGLLTRDGENPNDLVTRAEADLGKYPTVQLVDGRVASIVDGTSGFRVSFDGRSSTATTVILATGVNDDPPPIPGLAEHWGRGVFTCPFCDGYEHHDRPISVVGDPLMTPHLGRLLSGVTDRVTVHSPLAGDERRSLAAAGVTTDDRGVVRVIGDGTRITMLELSDGTRTDVDALFVAGLPHPNNQLARELGCAVDEMGFVTTDANGATNVDGVWAAGDLTSRYHQMAVAIAQGATAGAACAGTLIARRTDRGGR